MIQSMTGFGKVTAEMPSKKVTVEIKALNSKQLDLSTRISSAYREKEMQMRSLILKTLLRGKVEFVVYVENIDKNMPTEIDTDAVMQYFNQMVELSSSLGIKAPETWDDIQSILRLPEVLKTKASVVDDEEWAVVQDTIEKALENLIEFRKQEGEMLGKLFTSKIEEIARLLKNIEFYELERVEKIKHRIQENLEKVAEHDYDKNRFEQELIYYIEKLDVNEEKTRLDNHLKYFIKTMNEKEGQGKKLGFIVQEMGREINTLGSKSNHAEMQKIVIQMKDELEQIKEQVLNVL